MKELFDEFVKGLSNSLDFVWEKNNRIWLLINDVYIDVDCVSFIDSLLFIDCWFSIIFEIGKKEREFFVWFI